MDVHVRSTCVGLVHALLWSIRHHVREEEQSRAVHIGFFVFEMPDAGARAVPEKYLCGHTDMPALAAQTRDIRPRGLVA